MINSVANTGAGGYQSVRGTTNPQGSAFAQILKDKQAKGMSAKEYLKTVTAEDLGVLQGERRLACQIDISALSNEGAENLFVAWGDKKRLKDLNNDGIVEIGAGKTFVFPPVNAPEAVKDAWEKTVANMTLGERMRAEAPFLVAQLTANIRTLPGGNVRVLDPGDAGYKNAFGDSVGFYRGMINSLKNKQENDLKAASAEGRKNIEFGLKVISQFLENLNGIA